MKVSLSSDEKELVLKLKRGDSIAFEQLYDLYKYPLAKNVLRLVKSEDITEEIIQELFITIWRTRKRIDPDRSFSAYLHTIARNMVMDIFRKSVRDKKLEDLLMSTSTEIYSHIEEDIYTKETRIQIDAMLDLLPPKRRMVFKLCKLEGRSYKEVSEILNISVATVNDHVKKANSFLKNELCSSQELMLNLFLLSIFVGL